MRRIVLFGIGAGLVCTAAAAALTGEEIAKKAYDVLRGQEDSYTDYVVNFTQVTTDKDGEELGRAKCKMYFKKPDKVHVDVLEYYEGGEKKDPPEPEDNEKGDELDLKLPLDEDYFHDYRFTYKATESVSKKECYKVAFSSTKKSDGYLYGSIWVTADDYKIVKGKGQPYVQPEHCSESSMTMYFSDYGGRIMARKISMYAKATFLLFINKDIYINTTYTGYKFDQGIPDSTFD
jgi:outer membrane lipoprotein-sorting protein